MSCAEPEFVCRLLRLVSSTGNTSGRSSRLSSCGPSTYATEGPCDLIDFREYSDEYTPAPATAAPRRLPRRNTPARASDDPESPEPLMVGKQLGAVWCGAGGKRNIFLKKQEVPNFVRKHFGCPDLGARPSAAMHDEYALDAELPHVRHFTHVLSALRLSKKQLVRVGVSDRGITFVAVDDSKSVQAQASFRAETFSFFSANPGAASSRSQRGGHGHASSSTSNTSFDVSLQALIDTLNVFAPLDGETTVRMRWPDLDGKLVFAAAAQRDGARVSDDLVRNVTHASISTQDGSGNNTAAGTSSSTLNSELTFRGEKNAFMVATTTLKEIVDDLEWPGGYGSR